MLWNYWLWYFSLERSVRCICIRMMGIGNKQQRTSGEEVANGGEVARYEVAVKWEVKERSFAIRHCTVRRDFPPSCLLGFWYRHHSPSNYVGARSF